MSPSTGPRSAELEGRPRLDDLEERQRSHMFRLLVDEAVEWLTAGQCGDVPLGQAVWEANATFSQAVRMLVEAPVDGWPCEEQVA